MVVLAIDLTVNVGGSGKTRTADQAGALMTPAMSLAAASAQFVAPSLRICSNESAVFRRSAHVAMGDETRAIRHDTTGVGRGSSPYGPRGNKTLFREGEVGV
jgi:hypothetical protein